MSSEDQLELFWKVFQTNSLDCFVGERARQVTKITRKPARPTTTHWCVSIALRGRRNILTANIVHPSSSLHDENVVCHQVEVEGLEHEEDVPTFNLIG